ncbi:hypothetical protein [Photobacterium leiognathi]|uniref:hypothetical protein n=1 Tax=Photobacterium leiognathi TaxID=553611 RepID=UPI0029827E48|nr:hypothetical protein [Photobacterium leiognathi]
MKKPVLGLLLVSSLFGASAANANSVLLGPQLSSVMKSVNASSQFHTSAKDTFTSSKGQKVTIHLARDTADSRVLVMDTSWVILPLVDLTDKDKITHAANEYIGKHQLDVTLDNADRFYMNGSYGYAFDVTQTGNAVTVNSPAQFVQHNELLDCSIDQLRIENRIKCNQRYGGS